MTENLLKMIRKHDQICCQLDLMTNGTKQETVFVGLLKEYNSIFLSVD